MLCYPLYFDLPRHSLSGNCDKLHLKIMPNENKARANSLPQYGRINICAVISVADNNLSRFLFTLMNSQPIPPMTNQANWNAVLLCTHFFTQHYSHFSSIDGVIVVLHDGNHQNNETNHCLLISCTCVQVLKISRRHNARTKGKIYILHSYLL